MVSLIQDEACIQANVKVSPDVRIKNMQTYFVGDPVVEPGTGEAPECSYAVSQMVCVKYSLSFSADVQAAPDGIICSPQVLENSMEQEYADLPAGPSVAICKQEEELLLQEAADIQNKEPEAVMVPGIKDAPKRKALIEQTKTKNNLPSSERKRLAGRNISVSKSMLRGTFYINLIAKGSRH